MNPWTRVGLAVVVASLGALGCAPIIPVGAHVTQTGQYTSADDVWVLHGDVLKRCSNTPQGPICIAARQAAQ